MHTCARMALRTSTWRLVADRVRTSWTYRHARYSGGVRFSLARFMVTRQPYISPKFRRPPRLTKWGNPQYLHSSKFICSSQQQKAEMVKSEMKEGPRPPCTDGSETVQKKYTPKYCDMLFLHQRDRLVRVKPHANFYFK